LGAESVIWSRPLTTPRTVRYSDFNPASSRASRVARASSRKRDSRPELALRQALWRLGLRYRVDVASLPGRPDIVFTRARVAIFCDGDFWHGRDLEARLTKLERGHNPPYWVAKITTNVARDRRNDTALAAAGWFVLRFWETEILRNADAIAERVALVIDSRV
jgi:DNA mismatch endonuclease (patch repair protein)